MPSDSLGPNPDQHITITVTIPKPWADRYGLTQMAGVLSPQVYFAYLFMDAVTTALPDTQPEHIDVQPFTAKDNGSPGYGITYKPGPDTYYPYEDSAISKAFGDLVKGLEGRPQEP